MKSILLLAAVFASFSAVAQGTSSGIYDLKDRQFTADEVKKALAPPDVAPQQRTTRSLRTTRGINVEAATPDPPRKISLQLQFGFDSAEITDGARSRLDVLGSALQSPELAQGTYIISGHTDTSGRYDYNVALSKRRAEAVTEYLVSRYQIDRAKVIPVGKGPDELLDRGDPKSASNRRVQIEARN